MKRNVNIIEDTDGNKKRNEQTFPVIRPYSVEKPISFIKYHTLL